MQVRQTQETSADSADARPFLPVYHHGPNASGQHAEAS